MEKRTELQLYSDRCDPMEEETELQLLPSEIQLVSNGNESMEEEIEDRDCYCPMVEVEEEEEKKENELEDSYSSKRKRTLDYLSQLAITHYNDLHENNQFILEQPLCYTSIFISEINGIRSHLSFIGTNLQTKKLKLFFAEVDNDQVSTCAVVEPENPLFEAGCQFCHPAGVIYHPCLDSSNGYEGLGIQLGPYQEAAKHLFDNAYDIESSVQSLDTDEANNLKQVFDEYANTALDVYYDRQNVSFQHLHTVFGVRFYHDVLKDQGTFWAHLIFKAKKEDSDLAENEDSDLAENENSDPAKNEDSDPAENENSDPAKNEDSDLAENETSDPAKNEDSDLAENEDSDPAKNEDSVHFFAELCLDTDWDPVTRVVILQDHNSGSPGDGKSCKAFKQCPIDHPKYVVADCEEGYFADSLYNGQCMGIKSELLKKTDDAGNKARRRYDEVMKRQPAGYD